MLAFPDRPPFVELCAIHPPELPPHDSVCKADILGDRTALQQFTVLSVCWRGFRGSFPRLLQECRWGVEMEVVLVVLVLEV